MIQRPCGLSLENLESVRQKVQKSGGGPEGLENLKPITQNDIVLVN